MCTQSPRRFPSKACNLTFGGVDADMPDEAMGNTYTFISLWRPKQLQANRVILSEYRRAPENRIKVKTVPRFTKFIYETIHINSKWQWRQNTSWEHTTAYGKRSNNHRVQVTKIIQYNTKMISIAPMHWAKTVFLVYAESAKRFARRKLNCR